MSASLVGSEMCIRDRLGGGAAVAQAASMAVGCRRSGSIGGCGLPSAGTCLLYTSDAADDM
eukprot:6524516-Alexandrium_andersonii.AAC.1